MMKDSEVHFKNCFLIENCSISPLMLGLVVLVDRVLVSYTGGPLINSREDPFFHIAIKPRNILKYIANNSLRNISLHITTGHLHYRVYLGISVDFYDSVPC
jgi:hypothetical protein